MLDDGRLTDDGKGDIADFTNAVIIMTSNLGAQSLLARYRRLDTSPEEGKAETRPNVLSSVRAHCSPQLENAIHWVKPSLRRSCMKQWLDVNPTPPGDQGVCVILEQSGVEAAIIRIVGLVLLSNTWNRRDDGFECDADSGKSPLGLHCSCCCRAKGKTNEDTRVVVQFM